MDEKFEHVLHFFFLFRSQKKMNDLAPGLAPVRSVYNDMGHVFSPKLHK